MTISLMDPASHIAMASSAYSDIVAKITRSAERDKGYVTSNRPTRWFSWAFFKAGNQKNLPTQGWKLHVSCSPTEVCDMLGAVVPLLLAERVPAFKVPATLQGVLALNSNLGGRAQAGKILTIYPGSDEDAFRLIEKLSERWSTTAGPAIKSDVSVGSGTAIFARYGLFTTNSTDFDALGRPKQDLLAPDGSATSDLRSLDASQPQWVPSIPDHLVRRVEIANVAPVEQRYARIVQLGSSLRSEATAAIDIRNLTLVVLKRAERGVMGDLSGHDAISRLRNESHVLQLLGKSSVCVPSLQLFHEDRNGALLVQDYIEGAQLLKIAEKDPLGALLPLCDAIAQLHAAGFAHRDIKLENAMLAEGEVRLIDFELTTQFGDNAAIAGGTPGFIAPAGPGATPEAATDVYALGAVVFHAFSGISPSRLPLKSTRGRMLELLQALGLWKVRKVVAELTVPTSNCRPSMSACREMLVSLNAGDREVNLVDRGAKSKRASRQFARRASVSAGMAAGKFKSVQQSGTAWTNKHVHAGHLCQGINLGAAGVMLGLMAIDEANHRQDFHEDVRSGADWLAMSPPLAEAHGLFTGNAGVALALGVSSGRFSESGLERAALARLSRARKQEGDFDLFSGAAGVVWAGCLLSKILGSTEPLDIVHKKVVEIRAAVVTAAGVPVWRPSSMFNPDGDAYFGAAHGSAGIALALGAWSEAAGCTGSGELALEAYAGLLGQLGQGGHTLPEGPGRPSRSSLNWCHGAAGLVWCMLQLASVRATLSEGLRSCSFSLLAAGPMLANTTFCHGSAGVLELFRVLNNSLEDPAFGGHRALARNSIRALQNRTKEGVVWASENPLDFTPDLWVGFLGPAASLAMDAADASVPLLSSEWLTRCAVARPDRSLRGRNA